MGYEKYKLMHVCLSSARSLGLPNHKILYSDAQESSSILACADQSLPLQDEASLTAEVYEMLRTEWGIEKSDLKDVWCENPTPEYRREFTEMNVFAMKLYNHFKGKNLLDEYEVIQQMRLRLHTSVEQLYADDDREVDILERSGGHDLAKEYPLWTARVPKRMKGLKPEEKLDDRPDIYKRDPLMFGDPMPPVTCDNKHALPSDASSGSGAGAGAGGDGKEGNAKEIE